jgi:hypothetical protein
VALDSVITEELREERANIRDLVRGVQNLRKESGLEVTDRIRLWVHGSDRLKAAFERFRGLSWPPRPLPRRSRGRRFPKRWTSRRTRRPGRPPSPRSSRRATFKTRFVLKVVLRFLADFLEPLRNTPKSRVAFSKCFCILKKPQAVEIREAF